MLSTLFPCVNKVNIEISYHLIQPIQVRLENKIPLFLVFPLVSIEFSSPVSFFMFSILCI